MSAQLITQGWGAGLGISITVALPPFPNVPALPGVPQLARSLLFAVSSPPTVGTPATAGAIWQSTQAAPVWGVFDQDGNQVVVPDSVMDFGYRQEYKVSNYPVQQGQFATYNKVLLPYESSLVLTKGGNLASRTAFLQTIDALTSSLNLYNIRTPEKTYTNVNCTRAELSRRGAGNATYFDVELFFIQVVEVTSQYSATSNASVPSALPPANNGNTTAVAPSSAVQTSALAAIAPPVPTG